LHRLDFYALALCVRLITTTPASLLAEMETDSDLSSA
jgi:hypothetical protein